MAVDRPWLHFVADLSHHCSPNNHWILLARVCFRCWINWSRWGQYDFDEALMVGSFAVFSLPQELGTTIFINIRICYWAIVYSFPVMYRIYHKRQPINLFQNGHLHEPKNLTPPGRESVDICGPIPQFLYNTISSQILRKINKLGWSSGNSGRALPALLAALLYAPGLAPFTPAGPFLIELLAVE
jgi:hypothetical protein